MKTYTKYQRDEHNIMGAVVTGIAKADSDGRKVVLLKKKDGSEFHLESPEGTKLTICEQFKYIGGKK